MTAPAPAPTTEPNPIPPRRRATPKPVAGPRLGEALRQYNPDLRWFAPVVCALWAYTLGAVPVWSGLSPWWLLVPGFGSLAAGVALARRHYTAARYGERQRKVATWLAVAAGAVMTGWMVFAGHHSPVNLVPLGALVLLTVVFGMWFAEIQTRAPRVAEEHAAKLAERVATEQARRAEGQLERARDEWQEIVEQAKPGCGLTLVSKVEQKGGFYLDFADHPTKPVKYAGFEEMVSSMVSIASSRFSQRGITLSEGDLRPEQLDAAHMFRLHVFTSNEFRRSIPYPIDRPVGTIREPRVLGMHKDMSPLGVSLCGNHGVMCAGTGGGKTVFANNLIGGVLECIDAEIWVGGTDKLAPLVYPWLLPWLMGRTSKPAIQYVAGQDPRSVTEQLAELYREAKRRNSKLGRKSKHDPTPEEPAIVYLLEEASDLLMYHQDVKVRTFDGHNWNASQLLNALAKAARSASISVFLLTQFGIMDALGDHGSLMRRNLTFRVVGRTNTYTDGRDILTAMSAGDCTRLRDYTLMVQPSLEQPRVMPAKAYYLDGAETIGPVAEKYTERRTSWTPPDAGDAFRERWSAQRLPELAGIAADEGLSWPGSVRTDSQTAAAEMGQPALPAPARIEEKTHMSDDVQEMLAQAEAKMDVAIEQARKYGPLGPLMGEIFPLVNAENAPEFVPAGQLAFMLDRVPRDGDWDAAGEQLVGELRGKPWGLEPIERGGDRGWERDTILGTVRAFLEGTPPGEGTAVGTLVRKLDGDSREFVTTVEAGTLLGTSAAEAQRLLESESLPVQRPRLGDGNGDEKRPRGWFVADLRRAAGA